MDAEEQYEILLESVQRVMTATSTDEMSAFDLLIQAERQHGIPVDNEILVDDAIRFGSYRWN